MLVKNYKRRHSYIVRGVTLFFLLFISVDSAFPQYCSESSGWTAPVIGSSNTKTIMKDTSDIFKAEPDVIDVNNSQQDKPQNPKPGEDHCITCCGHILSGIIFNLTMVLEPSLPLLYQREVFLPSPPSSGTFHPPRSI